MGAMPAGAPVLRPMSVGEILDASFKVYRRNFVTMAKAILVVAVPFGLLSALIRASISPNATTISNISTSTTATPSASTYAANLTTDLVSILAAAVSTAVIYRVVGSAYLGNPSSWREAVSVGLRKAYSVLWVTVLSIMAFALIIAIPASVIALIAVHSTGFGVIAGFVLGIPALCALVWFWVVSQLAVPSLMLEGYKGTKALLRASRLVRHLWWRSFGCMVLVSLIVGVLTGVVAGVIVGILLAFSSSDLANIVVLFVSGVLTTVLFTPITASAYVVLSIDLRVRKEGYDIQLLASQLGSQPGSSALSFLPRPPLMWGGPSNGWGPAGGPWPGSSQPGGLPPPGQQAWGPPPPGQQAWGPPPPGQQAWGPPPPGHQPGWGPPTQPGWGPGQPGWVPPPQDWRPPPPTGWEQAQAPASAGDQADERSASVPFSGWVPQGQIEPENPPPLFAPQPPHQSPPPPGTAQASPQAPASSTRDEQPPRSEPQQGGE